MNKVKFCSLFLSIMCPLFNYAQVIDIKNIKLPQDTTIRYKTVIEHQTYLFKETDSANMRLTQITRCDYKGNKIEIIKKELDGYFGDTKIINFFDVDGKKIESYYQTIENEGEYDEIGKTFYEYLPNGKLKKIISFSYVKRIRADVDKGIDRPGGCIIEKEDYEKYKSWGQPSFWEYEYDNKGRLIKEFGPDTYSEEDLYTYEYDSNDRIKTKSSFNKKKGLIWVEKYTHYRDSSEFVRLWYEYDGTRSKDSDGRLTQDNIWKQKYDGFRNLIEDTVVEKNGVQVTKEENWYDEKNRIIRQQIYNEKTEKNIPIATYIFRYDIKNVKEGELIIKKE